MTVCFRWWQSGLWSLPQTQGFDTNELAIYFKKHVQVRKTIVAVTVIDYEKMADRFLGGPRAPSTLECRRAGGDLLRFDCKTDEFGLLDAAGVIRSYFRPERSRHKLPSNLHYMCIECRRVFLPTGGSIIV